MSVHRSYLFAPGNHPRKVAKVFDAGADAVVLDLEDAVAVAEKAATRQVVCQALEAARDCRGFVRVNAWDTPYCYNDLVAVVQPQLDGIVLPKVESAAHLVAIDWLIGQLEANAGMTVGTLDLVPIVETAAGMSAIDELCRAGTRVRRIAFGAGDYHRDLALEWTAQEQALSHARATLVLASRSAGLEPPIDTVVLQIRDHERFEASARRGREMGFQGKLCIHPDQVAPTNRIFSPEDSEVEHAKAVVAAFEEAEANGSASIQLDGYFIDYPIVEKAQRILDLAERLKR